MRAGDPVGWLLQAEQPSIRYLALKHLLERSDLEPEVVDARASIPRKGWAAQILAKQSRAGWWASGEKLYAPKYVSTNWMLLILSDLGLTRADKKIAKACGLWIKKFAKRDGGFGMDGSKRSHLCIVGNTARALVKFGYQAHPRVKSAFEWMVENAAEKGGWSCFGSGRNLDSWEPMSAFAVYPRQLWAKSMKAAVERGAEFYLERELHRQGDHYRPWYRFHYPVHYYYDLLVGLDFMTALGYGYDRRLKHAVDHLLKMRRPDGRWDLGPAHPDVEGATADWFAKHPKRAPTPFTLEAVGRPSRMVTLRAMVVLKRLGRA